MWLIFNTALIPWNALHYSALHFTVLQFSLPGARSQRLGARSQGLRVRSQEPGVENEEPGARGLKWCDGHPVNIAKWPLNTKH